MESVKRYLLSVICAAIACAIVASMTDKKGAKGSLVKLITGTFLVVTVISPIASLKIEELAIFTADIQEDAASAAAMGQEMAEESMAAYIKAETEAYILDKATTLNAVVTAEVILGEDLNPESVILTGEIAPYARFRLESILTEDLGISKENQQWNE